MCKKYLLKPPTLAGSKYLLLMDNTTVLWLAVVAALASHLYFSI